MFFKVWVILLISTSFSFGTVDNKKYQLKNGTFADEDCDTVHASVTNCAYYIFVSEDHYADPWQTTWEFAQYFVQNIAPNSSNIYGMRTFGDPSLPWCDVYSRPTKDGILMIISKWIDYVMQGDGRAYYTDVFQNLLNITQIFPNVEIFIQGKTDTITDLPNALSLAKQLASTSATIYVWDTSSDGDQKGLFAVLTGNIPGHVITTPNNLQSLIKAAEQQMFPDFVCRGCGGICSGTSPNPYPPTTSFSYASPSYIPPQSNTSCASLELIFILDRSQSVIEDFYNNFTFADEASASYPAYARFGVIQFSDDPIVSITLGNYSRQDFQNRVYNTVVYDDGGVSNLVDALNAATTQFKQNSVLTNRAIILVLNDVSMVDIINSLDAIHRLENYVSLPIGVITPGRWGNQQEALTHLKILLDNKTELAFPSLAAAENGIPALVESTFPCEKPPACSALIFILESSEAVGADSKLMFLKLAQQISFSIHRNPNQRFGLALYAQEVYQQIQLQTFEEFNKTIADFINIMGDVNFPNGGKTYLQPIFSNLNTVLTSGLYKNYAVLMMGEMEAVKDVGKAATIAKTIATLGADIYVIDESSGTIPYSLWNVITNNAPGHVLNGVGSNQDILFGSLGKSLIPEFNEMGC
uniref:VWFA domain-containing protein n=1 Tax=Panagrolaimus sp. ES5 TaxID=591445 RepID=A0AC34GNS3_9BILA